MPHPDGASEGKDRRHWPRVAAGHLARVAARLSTGAEVRLIDLSRGGARIETDRRMLPNSSITFKLLASDAPFMITGRIVRSRVIRLSSGGLGYDVAVAFNEPLHEFPELADVDETAQPGTPEAAPAVPPAATHGSADGLLPHVDAPHGAGVDDHDDPWPVAMIHVTASVDRTSEELIDLFDESAW